MDEWLQRMCVFQRGSHQAKQLSTSEIMGAVQKSESSCSFYENLWYSTTRILCALFSTSILTTKCTWHDFACIIWVKGTLAFGDLCLVMKRRNQNIQVTQERKLIKLPSHECNLFVWKDKGWNIPTDSQSLRNHRAGKHMNMPGKKFSIPGASANKGEGNFSTSCVLPTLNFRDLWETQDFF